MTTKQRITQLEKTMPTKGDAPIFQTEQTDGGYIVTYQSGRKVRQDTPEHCKTYAGGISPDDWDNE